MCTFQKLKHVCQDVHIFQIDNNINKYVKISQVNASFKFSKVHPSIIVHAHQIKLIVQWLLSSFIIPFHTKSFELLNIGHILTHDEYKFVYNFHDHVIAITIHFPPRFYLHIVTEFHVYNLDSESCK